MRKWLPLAAMLTLVVGCADEPTQPVPDTAPDAEAITQGRHGSNNGSFVIANRGSGTISVVDERTQEVRTITLPAGPGEPTPEPMYVVYNRGRVFVGDRANSRVAVFDARTYDPEGTAPTGNGVFHMWATPTGRQLWVNNDVDNTTTVIDTRDLSVIATVDTPADLVAMGGKPHDVIVGPFGRLAYVSVLGVAGDDDYVVQYDTRHFREVGRAAVGKDPHLSLARQHDRLYVPCQNSDVVIVLNRFTMEEMTRGRRPGRARRGDVAGRPALLHREPPRGRDRRALHDRHAPERRGRRCGRQSLSGASQHRAQPQRPASVPDALRSRGGQGHDLPGHRGRAPHRLRLGGDGGPQSVRTRLRAALGMLVAAGG
ncbi:MAG: YncE family protein [Candidatus Eisenbacteria bacterium]|uniref:YncE family protein n=1 Tax=Eiseniibacteriota bacterium TaxID=2212470 RepID=A0A956LWU6_UNCEI|nr:YncE family protein [Candidatus Eisenbacteria bacterium]